jgi:hypothetical protein
VKGSDLSLIKSLEAAPGFEPENNGFAGRKLPILQGQEISGVLWRHYNIMIFIK